MGAVDNHVGLKERVIELLGAGVSPVQAAMSIGISESYISQLLADETINARVKELRAQRAEKYIEHDDALDSDEEVARKLVRRNLDMAILKPMEALAHFKVLNAARRAGGQATAQTPVSTVVQLNLPPAAAIHFRMTTDKQIIEVDGRSMATMPANRLTKMLREKKAAEDLQQIEANGAEHMTLRTSKLLDSL